MNPTFGHTIIPIRYQLILQSHVTPFVPHSTDVFLHLTYPMWYNVIPPYIPLNPNLYSTYPTKIKWFDPLISRNIHIGYILEYVYLIPELIIPPKQTPHIACKIPLCYPCIICSNVLMIDSKIVLGRLKYRTCFEVPNWLTLVHHHLNLIMFQWM